MADGQVEGQVQLGVRSLGPLGRWATERGVTIGELSELVGVSVVTLRPQWHGERGITEKVSAGLAGLTSSDGLGGLVEATAAQAGRFKAARLEGARARLRGDGAGA